MSSFVLKVIALITMIIDHSGYVIFGKFSFFNYIGRLAFPIFAFGISEGYLHTKNLKKYFTRLGLFAIISQLPYYLFISSVSSDNVGLNIFFTLFLGLLAITLFDKCKYKILGILPVVLICFLSYFINCEYSWFGILLIFGFYLFKKHRVLMNIYTFSLMSIYYIVYLCKTNFNYRYIILYFSTVCSLIFINLYNGKKGKDSKYILYLLYPLQFLILYVINILIH